MKYLFAIFLLTSCATFYKGHENWQDKKAAEKVFTWTKDLRITYQGKPSKGNQDRFISTYFRTGKNPTHQIMALNTEETNQPSYGYHHGLASVFSLLTIGIFPYRIGLKLKATAKIKNLKTNKISEIKIDLEQIQGFGWYWWIKKWKNDNWYWQREGYDPYFHRAHEYYWEYTDYVTE